LRRPDYWQGFRLHEIWRRGSPALIYQINSFPGETIVKIARYFFLLLLPFLLAAAPVSGAANYKVTKIVLPPGADLINLDPFGKFAGINNQGVVSGWYHIQGTSYGSEAYRWENGVMTALPHLLGEGTYMTQAYAINNQGQSAGFTATPISIAPCLWQGSAPFTPAALPEGGVKARWINDLGQVVGYTGSYSAVLWQSGARTSLPILGTNGSSDAFGINKNGFIVGYCHESSLDPYRWPVLWGNDGIINLGDFIVNPIPERGGVAYAINDLNQVVGYAIANYEDYDFGVGRAFLWENDQLTNLGALYSGGNSCAMAINNLGQIVGYSYSGVPPYGNHAILWEKGDMIDLNTRIDPIPGWYLREAQAINDKGQIVCLAEDYDGVNSRIYLLTPVSSPAAISLLLLDD
jgi:probable HAF family extracellular repeat protein